MRRFQNPYSSLEELLAVFVRTRGAAPVRREALRRLCRLTRNHQHVVRVEGIVVLRIPRVLWRALCLIKRLHGVAGAGSDLAVFSGMTRRDAARLVDNDDLFPVSMPLQEGWRRRRPARESVESCIAWSVQA